MKLTKKNLPTLLRLTLIFMVIFTLLWELTKRLVSFGGGTLDLSVGPVGFDIQVIALWLQVNPGTVLGIIPAVLVFRRL